MNDGNMFSGCSSLTSIDLTFLNIKSAININYMFLNCSKLETIKLKVNLQLYPLDEKGLLWLLILKVVLGNLYLGLLI